MSTIPLLKLLALDSRVRLIETRAQDEQLTCLLVMTNLAARCPQCQHVSRRVHSYYTRHLADIPVGIHSLHLELRVRKFFCAVSCCSQRIFAERLGAFAQSYARCTQRLTQELTGLACELGGEASARMAQQLHLGSRCPSTMLNLIRRVPDAPTVTPRVLGVDDWAKRKGRTYGTILCDLERHCVIDLLPDRESATLAAWLQSHPGVEIICRDRANAYAEGARIGAPYAIQIADRFHLLVNLSDFLKRLVERHHDHLIVEVTEVLPSPPPKPAQIAPHTYTGRSVSSTRAPSQLRAYGDRRRLQRAERYEHIRQLHQQDYPIRRIMREMNVARNTIRSALASTGCPEHGLHQRRLKPFIPYLTEHCQQGERNARKLFRDLQTQGYTGSYFAIVLFVMPYRKREVSVPQPQTPVAPSTPPEPVTRTRWLSLSNRQVTRWLADACPDMTDTDRNQLDQLCQLLPDLALARSLAADFKHLLIDHQPDQLAGWIERAKTSQLPEFESFAQSLLSDKDAVLMAAKSDWSSGQVEGQVNRLKLIKRQMYGRGNLDLLRKRVLHRSAIRSKTFT
jgi:transposase